MNDPKMMIRPTHADDIPALRSVLDQTALFPSDMLPDMLAPFLAGSQGETWLTAEGGAADAGLCYAREEPFAAGCWNLLAIAIHPAAQGCGVGRAITKKLEAELSTRGARILIVDTSGTPQFEAALAFYTAVGYRREAQIEGYWAPGDDKVTFWKRLGEG
ncbi:MAG: GNAT family N-acetyltransferase [Pseudomonadota bacterium]